jgi:hypothetical protein
MEAGNKGGTIYILFIIRRKGMRAFLAVLLIMGLGASPLLAKKAGETGKEDPPAAASSATAAPDKPAAKPATLAIEEQLQELRSLLQSQMQEVETQRAEMKAQQQKIEALEERLRVTNPSEPVNLPPMAVMPAPATLAKTMPASTVSLASSAPAREMTPQESKTPGDPVKQLESRLSDLAFGKVKIGGTFYGFYSFFPRTGFGPQTLDNTDIYPGPGNNWYNEFNINRTYINIYYQPTDAITLRVTPNVYREVGGATAQKLSSTSGAGSSVNGNLSFRLKYAYVAFNNLFTKSAAFGRDKLTFGQTQQPLTDWEEGLYQYRFVNLTPWNDLSLSSTYIGVKLNGPVDFNGKQYLDYEVGVFNDSSYHAYEVGDKKQVMARLSYYPLGAASKYDGLGLTGFVDYGYKDVATDQNNKVPDTRVAALVHYQSKSGDYGIAGEFDWGHNAFSEGNLFSGSGPVDFFGLGTSSYASLNDMAGAFLGGSHTKQMGYAFLGHARLGHSPFSLFGMFQQFSPNTNVNNDPLDFYTLVGGISYKYGKYWTFALDSKNILYYHSQFTVTNAQLALFSPTVAAKYPTGIANAVPSDTNQVSFNILFNF